MTLKLSDSVPDLRERHTGGQQFRDTLGAGDLMKVKRDQAMRRDRRFNQPRAHPAANLGCGEVEQPGQLANGHCPAGNAIVLSLPEPIQKRLLLHKLDTIPERSITPCATKRERRRTTGGCWPGNISDDERKACAA